MQQWQNVSVEWKRNGPNLQVNSPTSLDRRNDSVVEKERNISSGIARG